MTHSSSRINPRVTGSYPVTPPFGFCEGSICRLKVHCFPKVYIYYITPDLVEAQPGPERDQ